MLHSFNHYLVVKGITRAKTLSLRIAHKILERSIISIQEENTHNNDNPVKLVHLFHVFSDLIPKASPEMFLDNLLRECAQILQFDAATIVLWESQIGFFNTIFNIPSDITLRGTLLKPEQGGLDGRLFRESDRNFIELTNYSKNMDVFPPMKSAAFQYAMGFSLSQPSGSVYSTICFYSYARTKRITPEEQAFILQIGLFLKIAISYGKIVEDSNAIKKISEEYRNLIDLILNASPDIIINIDLAGKIKFWNNAVAICTKYSTNEMLNQKIPLVLGENEGNFYQILGQVRLGHSQLNQHFLFAVKKESDQNIPDLTRIVNLSFFPVKSQKGEIDSILITGQDLSEKHALKQQLSEFNLALTQKEIALSQKEDELIKTQQELEAAEKLALIGALSEKLNHQINNPLMSMLNLLELLHQEIREQYEPKEYSSTKSFYTSVLQPYFVSLSQEGLRINSIMKSLRYFSVVAKDRHYRDNTDVIEALNQVLTEIRPQLVTKNIKLHYDKKIIQSQINGHFNQLKFVFSSILDNAIWAIENRGLIKEPGQIYITTNRVEINKIKYIQISIEDNGVGIVENDLPHLFDPFYTNWSSNPPDERKMDSVDQPIHVGLSLATVRVILFNHQAQIIVKSNQDIEKNKRTLVMMNFPEVEIS